MQVDIICISDMIDIVRKFSLFKIHDCFFAEEKDLSGAFKIVRYAHSLTDVKKLGLKRIEMATAYTDLTLSVEDIIEQATSNKKNVKRVMRNGGIVCAVTNDVDRYLDFFNDFAKSKHINGMTREKVDSYGANHLIFEASLDGNVLAMQTFLADPENRIAVLWTSSNKRFGDNKERTLIGYATRILTYWIMGYLKEHGYTIFDWGGIATEEEILRNPGLRTVNEYKLSFGCEKVSNYIYESFLYRLMHRVALLTGVIKSNDELQEDDKKD